MQFKEQLLFRLTELMFQKQQTFLLLDELYEDEVIGSSIRNIQIDSPFQQLLFEGVLSQSIVGDAISVSFTVEAYFQYVLAKHLHKDNRYVSPESLLHLLKENKLKGLPQAVSNLLSFDVEKGDFDRLTDFIDLNEEDRDALDLCVMPLIQSLKVNGIEKTLKVVLKNQTENDWKFLILVKTSINDLQLFALNNLFVDLAMNRIQIKSYYTAYFTLLAIPHLAKEKGLSFLSKIRNIISSFETDNRLLGIFANCEVKFGNFKNAIHIFYKCVNLEINKPNKNSFILAGYYSAIGSAYKSILNYKTALEYFDKSHVIFVKLETCANGILATSFNNLGVGNYLIDNLNKAYEYLSCCLDIQLNLLGIWHNDVAITYLNISQVLSKNNDFKKAIEYSQKALDVTIKVKGTIDLFVASIYNNIGLIYFSATDYNFSIEFYNKSIEVFRLNNNELNPECASTFVNMGIALDKQCKYDDALGYYKKGALIYMKVFGCIHRGTISSFEHIAESFANLNNYKLALRYFNKCLKYQILFSKIKDNKVAYYLEKIGFVYLQNNNFAQSIKYLKKSQIIQMNTTYVNNECIYLSFYIGYSYFKLNEYKSAIIELKRGFEIEGTGGYACLIAESFEALKEKENALSYYIQSATIRKDNPECGLEDQSTQESINNAKRLAKQLNKENELPSWMK